MNTDKLDEFTQAYIECALWTSTFEYCEECDKRRERESEICSCGVRFREDTPMDSYFSMSDIAPITLEQMVRDCAAFQADNAELLAQGRSADYNGHDFWLTRNRHGAGYWDRGLGEVGDKLTDAAHAYGSCDLYVGDNGQIYQQ